MEGTRISIFEKISLISLIMPFYSYSHNAFLVLASLWMRTRNKLDEFYEEFRNTMKNKWMSLTVEDNFRKLLLPNDLFSYTIIIKTSDEALKFIEFISRIVNKQGYYFRNHYMHEHIKILSISVFSSQVEVLYSKIEEIRSFRILSSSCYSSEDNFFEKNSLLDAMKIRI